MAPETRYPSILASSGKCCSTTTLAFLSYPKRTYSFSRRLSIFLPISSFLNPPPLIITPSILPTSFNATHSGATSANTLTHLIMSSLPIGFRNDICRCCTSVGIVKETGNAIDLTPTAAASSLACFFEEKERLSSTGMISCRRWSADFRAKASAEGGRGRVDWWSCLALSREKRSVDRAEVCFVFG